MKTSKSLCFLTLATFVMLGPSAYCTTKFKLTVQLDGRGYIDGRPNQFFGVSYLNHGGIPVLIPICQDKVQSAGLLDTLKASPGQKVELSMRSKNGYAKIDSISADGNLCVEDVQIILNTLE